MRVKGRGFILFSFAFSSVLSTVEVLQIPGQSSNDKPSLDSVGMGNKTGNSVEKRSAGGFEEEKEEKKGVEDMYVEKELEKRARLGFTGMRGKKEYSPDDYCGDRVRMEGLNLNKRIPTRLNDLIWGGKRGSYGFHGMRGKKSGDYDEDEVDSYSKEDFLITSGLVEEPEEERMEEMMEKRSPYAFQGMRGKKETAYDLKRAMGFLGMRGKKGTEVWNPETNYKRTPQTSFFGMKGKKAQSSGFFGMRGKKASPNTFFGIKGKREPSEFQSFSYVNESEAPRSRFRRGIAWLSNSKKAKNAFFGIRGKKSTEERSGYSLSRLFD